MCGLVAIIQPGGVIDSSLLDAMRDRLWHRGPDSGQSAILQFGGAVVGLAHRRLSILDLRTEAGQPFHSPDGKCHLVFNGEIYNFIELRQELKQLGHHFSTDSDTEVLLAAYQQWGERCMQKLNGMFAFVIWDERLGKAFVARDRFGEKPLFYARLPSGGVAFASEIKALTAHPLVDGAPEINEVERALSGVVIHSREKTMFTGVRRFSAAHSAWVDVSGEFADYRRYWTPDYTAPSSTASLSNLAGEFRELLSRSVAMRTRSDVKGAACLSGGLDSSTLVGMLAQSSDNRGFKLEETISARFPKDPTIDEGEYIDDVLRTTGLRGAELEVGPEGLLKDARSLLWHHEELVPSTSMYLEWCVMRRARELGYKVMIDGQGADELLGGYQYFFQYRQLDQYTHMQYADMFLNTQLFRLRLWLKSLRYADYERRIQRNPGMTWNELKERRLPLGDPYKYPDAPGLPPLGLGGDFKYALSSSLLYDSLPVQLQSGDSNSMAHGVEARFPFLDYELVDWCIRLPSEAFIHNGWQKYILRKASAGLISKKVRWRSDKIGYMGPQDVWIRDVMNHWVEERLFDPILEQLPSYNRSIIEGLWRQHSQQQADHSTYLWQWASMAEWLSMHKEGVWRDGMNAQAIA